MSRKIDKKRDWIIFKLRQEGQTYRQIASILKISTRTAYNAYYRVLKGDKTVYLSTG